MPDAIPKRPPLAVFRPEALQNLKEMLPPDDAAVLIAKFEGSLRHALVELQASADKSEEVVSLMHKVTAMAGTLGFEELAELSRDVMYRARENLSGNDLKTSLQEFFAASARALKALDAFHATASVDKR